MFAGNFRIVTNEFELSLLVSASIREESLALGLVAESSCPAE